MNNLKLWSSIAAQQGQTPLRRRTPSSPPPTPTMASRLGRRVVHFPNLPLKLLLPPAPLQSVQEFAVKTLPSASKIDIRRCLESVYGFDIAEVRTLNMEGKKTRRGYYLAAKPDYKKAYITLKSPLSVDPSLFPIPQVLKAKAKVEKKEDTSVVVKDGEQGKHWLDERKEGFSRAGFGKIVYNNPGRRDDRKKVKKGRASEANAATGSFPWSGMKSPVVLAALGKAK